MKGDVETIMALPAYEPRRKRLRLTVKIKGPGSQCRHDFVKKHRCMDCGFRVADNYGRALRYVSKGFRMGEEGIRQLKRIKTTACFAVRKLHLVLDLDHTLLHSRSVKDLKPEERYLIEEEGSREDVKRIGDRLIKFRPFLFEFLREANRMFELSLYSKDKRRHAVGIARFLDPQGIYFRCHSWDRVITRKDSPGDYKTLDLVMADERGVIIIDDTQKVWPASQANLLVIPPYKYFAPRGHAAAAASTPYCVQRSDESEAEGWLATVLEILKQIHASFFEQECGDGIDGRDVRPIIQKTLDE